jgi:O-antigen ligase
MSVEPRPALPVGKRRAPSLGFAWNAIRADAQRRAGLGADDWPRTSRLLPWLLAVFIGLLWLVPFNSVALAASFPIDLQLDRLALGLIVVVWLASLAAGGAAAPSIHITPVHVMLGVFVAVASVSVLLNSETLAITREIDQSIKKLTLLLSYSAFFVLVASVVRPSEVRAFSILTLGLACVCALGTIYEYRFRTNLFYLWTDKLLPSMFDVELFSSGIDAIGRQLTRGPTQHGLEVATILAMAMPVAIVGLLHATRRRDQILYTLAAGLVFAAAVSTYRKTAFIAPAAGLLTLVLMRPRYALKMLPVAAVILVLVHVLTPGALGSVAVQLTGERLEQANTVNGREADYDAVRPDLLSNPVLGRGYGSYDQQTYRILDSEYLHRVLETAAARGPIRARDAVRGPPALAAAGAAASFLVASALFDAVSFPHTPYVFLSLAGMAAVCVRPAPEEAGR